MIGLLIGVIVFVLIVALIVSKSKPRATRRKGLRNEPIPENLGIRIEGGVPIVHALDKSLTSFYLDNVKNRVLRERPSLADYEFEWTLLEMKRYFVMNSLLRSVPMFSARVDDIWHEMLMFTRDYEKFSKEFYGETLHHIPNMESTPIPGERAFFDWVYLSLFEQTTNSRLIWGGFLQNPIKRETLEDFKQRSEEELLRLYFRDNEDWLDVKKALIKQMKNQIHEADQLQQEGDGPDLKAPSSIGNSQLLTYALGAAVFYSIYEEFQYQEFMSDLIPNEFQKGVQGNGYACSGYACSSDDHSGGDSGGDSGGSSCSSCGGGCSS
ncbi:hypothetical protein [Bacillus sp. PS06]|uniref:hypothetical protein n=1 Tax=Bacillus sp. PS06 TaxID=2764176 RepID=UPI00177F67BD|nr:hypothetical protein [Bacillus sp. PS06]MBD8068715.1 hypothetical protein [Bacillus sp. PS06]